MRYKVLTTKQYERDVVLSKKRGLDIDELISVVNTLSNGERLPFRYRDHSLSGIFNGCRECHIRPDWLLIYRKSSDNGIELLTLVRTGTHDDLFGRVKR